MKRFVLSQVPARSIDTCPVVCSVLSAWLFRHMGGTQETFVSNL